MPISLIVWCICSKHYHIGCFGNFHYKDKIWRLTDFDLCLEADVGAALGGEVPDVHDVPRRPLGVGLVVAVGQVAVQQGRAGGAAVPHLHALGTAPKVVNILYQLAD